MSDRALMMDQVKVLRDYLQELEVESLKTPPDFRKIIKLSDEIDDHSRELNSIVQSWAND